MAARGVEVFSITDHDTVGAYATARALVHAPVTLVSGVEINTTYKGNEVHVLGFGVPLGASAFAEVLERNRASRRVRAGKMVSQLQAAGYPVTLEAVEVEAGGGEAIGRPHIAKALVRAGLAKDVPGCFKTLLGRNGVGYVPSLYITPQEAIAMIAADGGIPVLAHPGRLRDHAIIDELADAGLAGLEVFYPTHSSAQVAYFSGRARARGLVMTAGSDFHDPRLSKDGVGVDVERESIAPFLDLIRERA
jgi:predicted metal-dependent phosphoesterase TrpH